MINFRLAVFLASSGLLAQTAVEPRIPSETLPAGGGIQIKLELTSPNPIIVGHFEMDSYGFSGYDGVSVFSSSGDAYGVAFLQGGRFIANLVSPQGSLGTQPDYPFFVVAANIPAGLAAGTRIPLSIGSGTTLTSPGGTPYSIPAPKSGVLTIGGTVSITNVIPGGGLLPPGTEVRLLGTGFDAETRVDVNEVLIDNLRVISPTEIRFNLSQAVQMTAKRIRVRDRRGSEAVYYSYLRATPMGSSSRPLLNAAYPVFSSNAYASAVLESGAQPQSGFIGVAVLNSGVSPAQVALALVSATGATLGQATVALPGGSRWSRTLEEAFNSPGVAGSSVRITSNIPVHVMGLRGDEATGNVAPFAPGSAPPPPPPAGQISTAPGALQFTVPQNGSAPAPRNVQVTSTGTPIGVSAAATASWITISPASGVTPLQLSLGVNPAGLPVGSHSATVNLTAANGAAASVPVTLVVEAPPAALPLVAAPSSLSFSYETGAPFPGSRNVQVSSGGTPRTVSVASSAAWLNASPASGATPLSLSVSVNPAGLAAGNYSAALSLASPGTATISVPVLLTITTPLPSQWTVAPATLRFQSTENEQRTTQAVNVRASTPGAPFAVTVEGSWLAATPLSGQSPSDVLVTANSGGLAPGSYTGAVTIRPSTGTAVTVPVSLTVTATPAPQLVLSTSSFEFVYTPGGLVPDPPLVQVASSGTALPIQVTSTAPWITAAVNRAETPANIRMALTLSGLAPGTHTGGVVVTPAHGTPRVINIAVQVLGGRQDPTITSIVTSAAQSQSTGLAPGEIISIYGSALAGSTRTNSASGGRFETLIDGVRVWIGNTPAPILYLSPGQINVQVPFELAGGGTVGVSVEYQGVRSAVRNLTQRSVSPAIFTVDASGRGQAALLNQDYARNTGSSPAKRGSAIMIFGTGGGATVSPSESGALAGSHPNPTRAGVFVWIGGQRVPALYSGTSPGSLSGLLQVNAIVPDGVAAGARVPLVIEVDGVVSQDGVTIAVE